MCKFGTLIREHWKDWTSLLGFMTTGTVDVSWMLTLGALTVPGAWAEKLEPVPMSAASEKQQLMTDKQNGKSLVDFLVAEVFYGASMHTHRRP
jgi:hypothetical protein